jgi:uncharacterized protein YjeT (DUF2065 family)
MSKLLGDIFTFIVEKGKMLFLIVSIAILFEGAIYLIFPKKIKRILEDIPLSLLRIFGGLEIIFGIILILFYLEILRRFL